MLIASSLLVFLTLLLFTLSILKNLKQLFGFQIYYNGYWLVKFFYLGYLFIVIVCILLIESLCKV